MVDYDADLKKAAKIGREMGLKARVIPRQHHQNYMKLYRTMTLNGKEFSALLKQWKVRIEEEGIHGLEWQADNDPEYWMFKLFGAR